jgi:hypothetical protein
MTCHWHWTAHTPIRREGNFNPTYWKLVVRTRQQPRSIRYQITRNIAQYKNMACMKDYRYRLSPTSLELVIK